MTGIPANVPLWCIIQADGDKAYATSRGSVPVQFCSIGGSQSLLQCNVQRALHFVRPRHVIATVAAGHRRWWSGPLWHVPPQRRIIDESTGRLTVTLAVALALVERSSADALVVVQPGDAFCSSQRAYVSGLARAIYTLQKLPAHIVALTVEALMREAGHDYLVLGPEDGLPGRSAVSLVKRPDLIIADRLIARGARVSTGVYVARLPTLISILEGVWPDLMTAARSLAAAPADEIVAPVRMPGTTFLRPWRHTWVQRPLPRLRAVAVDSCGWSALSPTPQRTADALIPPAPRTASLRPLP